MGVRELRLVVEVADHAEAVRFYRDVLGLPEQAAVAGPDGAVVTILSAGRATLELANPAQRRYIDQVEVGRDVSPPVRVAFEVDDVVRATGAVVAAGATELGGPRETPFGSVNARVDAPGLQVTLFQRVPPEVREASDRDWDGIWPFFREIVAAGETYTLPRDIRPDAARALWFPAGGRTVVAVDAGRVVGTAKWQPNQGGAGAHVANASFMVDPAYGGRGVGRALGEHVLAAARADGFRAMQFNAVVASNADAVRLWRSLGFAVVGTVPAAFDHPLHGPVDLLVMHRSL
jgi:L-amino acid N-acyltransferase YncA/predicted enzyme related to lactoylglutathione lyase